jgi:hypothetical protein
MTPYQQWMKRFSRAGAVYATACPIVLWWTNAPIVGWVVYASTCFLHYCLAVGFDAVHDSLLNRVSQSRDGS